MYLLILGYDLCYIAFVLFYFIYFDAEPNVVFGGLACKFPGSGLQTSDFARFS